MAGLQPCPVLPVAGSLRGIPRFVRLPSASHHPDASFYSGAAQKSVSDGFNFGSAACCAGVFTVAAGAGATKSRRCKSKMPRRGVFDIVKPSEEEERLRELDPGYLPAGVSRSMVSAVLTGSFQQRCLTPLVDLRVRRVLILGMGKGKVAKWLEHTFPDGKLFIDVVEPDKEMIQDAVDLCKFKEGAVRPLPTGLSFIGRALKGDDNIAAAAAIEDVIATADTQTVRIYNVDAGAYVQTLAGSVPKEFRYDMIFMDGENSAPWVLPMVKEGGFLPNLEKIKGVKCTIGLNLQIDIAMDGKDGRGEPEEIRDLIQRFKDTICGPVPDIFSLRPPDVFSSGNKIYCFCCLGRPQYLRGGPSIKWAVMQNAQTLNTNFPDDRLGKKFRFDMSQDVMCCYRDWPPGKDITPDEPWLVYAFAAPLVLSVVYYVYTSLYLPTTIEKAETTSIPAVSTSTLPPLE